MRYCRDRYLKSKAGVWLLALSFLVASVAHADSPKTPSFVFASMEEGAAILSERDEFVQRLSPFDRAARLKTSKDISEAEYVSFVKHNVMNWSSSERDLVESVISDLRPRLQSFPLEWPKSIYLIKSTGKEEGGAAYTRGDAIVLPSVEMQRYTQQSLRKVIAHELFHILTRSNAILKEQLYADIGFHQCGEINFPSKLKSVKITNPDAPKNDHCIRLIVAGQPAWAVPILYSRASKYDDRLGGEFFDYLTFQFLLVDGNGNRVPRKATFNESNLRLVEPNRVSEFLEQVGRNTDYIIHPEEILADNFALLVLGETRVPSPDVLKRMKVVLEQRSRK